MSKLDDESTEINKKPLTNREDPSTSSLTDAFLKKMLLVSRVGLEPTTPSLRGSCSNLLSYRPDSLIYYHFFEDLSIKFLART